MLVISGVPEKTKDGEFVIVRFVMLQLPLTARLPPALSTLTLANV